LLIHTSKTNQKNQKPKTKKKKQKNQCGEMNKQIQTGNRTNKKEKQTIKKKFQV
jgi:hypothetical protein